jgi:hypothetical protein
MVDIGALARIRSGHIQVVPEIKRLFRGGAELVDGRASLPTPSHWPQDTAASKYVVCWTPC